MNLLSVLQIGRGERVALVGGGGKTGLAYRLVAEARERGWTAVFSTTTKFLPPDEGGENLVLLGAGEPDLAALRRRLLRMGWLLLAKGWLPEWDQTPAGRRQKLGGFDAGEMARLAEALAADLVVVEADGSRHRPFKAPAGHEPVIPPTTSRVLVLAGLTVLGRPLGPAWVHRPDRVVDLVGAELGAVVGPELLAEVLSHPQGGRKAVPPSARAVAVLTQAAPELLPAGREVARRLLRKGGFEAVLLLDLECPDAGGELWCGDEGYVRQGAVRQRHVQAVILAAGGSSRMEQSKLLLPLGEKPMLAHAVDAALGSQADRVWVVLGAEAEAVRQALGTRPVQFLLNRRWAEGLSTSVRQAVAALQEGADGVLFLAGDMPFVTPAHLDRLIAGFQAGATVVWSTAGEAFSIPAIFGREAYPALMCLEGDAGGRALAGVFEEMSVSVAPEQLCDIDTPSAYEQARARLAPWGH